MAEAAAFSQAASSACPLYFLPLLISATTGMGYRLGKSWFNLPHSPANFLLSIHQGAYLGPVLTPLYILWVGVGAASLILTGWVLSRRPLGAQSGPSRPRRLLQWHGLIAPIVAVPLFVTTITGVAYYFGSQVLGLSTQQTSLLLRIHQGSYLGSTLKVYYVLLLGLGVCLMAMSGIQMTSLWRRWRARH